MTMLNRDIMDILIYIYCHLWDIENCTKKTIIPYLYTIYRYSKMTLAAQRLKICQIKNVFYCSCCFVCCTIQRVVIKQIAEALQRSVTKGVIVFIHTRPSFILLAVRSSDTFNFVIKFKLQTGYREIRIHTFKVP